MNEKSAVLVFSTAYFPFVGGTEVAIEQVANRLKNRFDFVIFTSRMRRDLPKREVRNEGLVVRIGFGNKFDKFLLPVFGALAAHKFKKNKQKIILWGMDLSFGALAAALFKFFNQKIPFVFTIEYGYGDKRVASGRLGVIGLTFRFILMQSDYITAISNYLLNLCKQYGYIGEEAVIHNGVDIEKFTNQESRTGNHVIISTSRRVYKNGLDILEKAFEIVKKKFPDAELKIVSDVPYDELPKYLWKADIFARPSRSEGMGNAFVEALVAGLPIVGTPVGGILDIIRDGETGLFAKVDDPKDLADKIKILLADKALARKIVENGKKMVEERFSWNKIAAQYAETFNFQLNVKKRVLIATGIFPPEGGGPATYSKILLDELPKENLGVRVLNFGSVKKLPKGISHIIYFIKALQLGKNANIIFAQDTVSAGLPAMLAAKVLRKKFILKIVGDYAWEQGVQRFGVKEVLDDFLKNKYSWEVELLRKIERWVANRADKIIVPSKYLRGVVEKWGIKPEKIYVVYNAFDAPELYISKENARKQLGISEKILVSAGRDVPWKGFQTLRDLMQEISRQIPNAKLFILSNEPREKLLLYLRAADIFVLNTAYEGFSHLILEAMSLGVPVVTTDAGGNPELIKDGKEGFLVKFNDKEALKTKILEIFKNPLLAEKLAKSAREKSTQFSKERMINGTIKIIENL